MENASKALLMAAGMFLAVLILSSLVVAYNQISNFYAQKHESVMTEQTKEFNARFENYHRNDLRGSELISLMNRVIDYNTSQAYQDEINYEEIKVTITLGGDEILEQFKGPNAKTTNLNKYLTKTITNKGIGNKWDNDKKLVAITNTPSDLCTKADTEINITNMTDTKLQQLSSKIDSIIIDESTMSPAASYSRIKRAEILEDILGIKVGTSTDCIIQVDKDTGITKKGNDIIEGLKDITSQYYQYTQFKRAYFDCTEMRYDSDTNRVVEMKFELQVKNGVVVFN